MKYVYDSNGNLTGKVDPRNVTTSYGYDSLNRNIWTSYSDGITPTLERHYDAASNGKGRLYYTVNYNLHPLTSAAAYSYTQINGYDAMGRVTGQTQNFLNTGGTWTGYTTSRTYDLAGHPLVQTYPSNRTVTNTYGDSGRLTSNVGTLGDGSSRNYATGITYTAAGLMSRETFGMQASTLYHNLHYNNRQQLVDIRVGDSSTDEWNWTRGALIFYYGATARDGWNAFANSTDNNGNVLRQINYVPLSGGGNVIPQLDDYNYDALNRITSVSESQQNSSGGWTFNLFTQNFGYDRWGNRTVSCSPCQSGVTGDTFTVDTATNRLTAKNGVGMTYDSAGNQTYDATGNRWFDGENRMHKATQGSVTSHYVYDADGKRVRRIIGSTETWMVYGLDGELVAEYAASGSASSPQKEYGYRGGQMLIVAQTSPLEIRWTVTDHLGTPRMNIMGNGASGGLLNSVKRHDYLPFGEELVAGVGLRSSSSHGYEPPSDGVRQKFTSYERDIDTGLDFAEARYYANAQGRFTGIDPLNPILEYRPQNEKAFHVYLNHPQNWNRFVYVSNQPLALIDPDGRGWKRVDGLDSNGKATFHYEWVDDMNVHDAPFGFYQYVDTQGQVVMLNSTSDGKWHQWAIEVATIDSDWDSHLKNVHTNDNSATPTGHREYRDMKQDLLNAGYKRHWDPLHPGAMNFWTDKSPTLNISVYTSMNFLLEESLSFDVVIRVEAHNEKHNPHKEMYKHITQEVIPHYFPNLPKIPTKPPKIVVGRGQR